MQCKSLRFKQPGRAGRVILEVSFRDFNWNFLFIMMLFCAICQFEFGFGETIEVLRCEHYFHVDCLSTYRYVIFFLAVSIASSSRWIWIFVITISDFMSSVVYFYCRNSTWLEGVPVFRSPLAPMAPMCCYQSCPLCRSNLVTERVVTYKNCYKWCRSENNDGVHCMRCLRLVHRTCVYLPNPYSTYVCIYCNDPSTLYPGVVLLTKI